MCSSDLMADDLRVLASGRAAALKVELDRHDMAGIAEDAAESLASTFQAAGVRLNMRLRPVEVMCDARRIYEVAVNLLSNAAKFTPAGGSVTLETGLRTDAEQDGGTSRRPAMLRVSDTGIGIPADELPYVSQRFFRGQQSADVSGSGIGLAIVDQLARLHRGRMEISSEEGRGTQVTITLPVAPA